MRAKPTVESLKRYVAPLEGRRGVVRLDFNENTLGPSPKVVEAIRSLPPEAYATYPEYDSLTARYAAHIGLMTDQVALFNGSDAAIKATLEAYGEPGARLVTTSPTFGYYRPCADVAGMITASVPYLPDFSFPWDAIRAELRIGAKICIICNPNNPTSTLVAKEPLLQLASEFEDTLFVIDEIYSTYTNVTVLPEGAARPNILALHSLSKSSGIAALRIGFACGPAAIVDRVQRVTGPYDINQFGVVAAHAVLDDWASTERYVAEVGQALSFTLKELQALGVRHYYGGGNYLLVWPTKEVGGVERDLRMRGFLVRNMHGKPLLDGAFRLSVGTRGQMQAFFAAFREVLEAP